METLYLIPTPLGNTSFNRIFPPFNLEIIRNLRFFIVEDVRTARRFLKQVDADTDIDKLTFFTLNEHTSLAEVDSFLQPLREGEDMGLLSEAGCPAVADPGADVVAIAQKNAYCVVPLVGPSSILLALMASGFNGQNFAFVGYLPVSPAERIKAIRKLEARAYSENQTQIFIETPYRNGKLFNDILQHCRPSSLLCIAANVTLPDETIVTRSVSQWKKATPNLDKKPCIFLIYKA
jgi:16S rRNA (cytidine1402-2'-O)-methyltransferase